MRSLKTLAREKRCLFHGHQRRVRRRSHQRDPGWLRQPRKIWHSESHRKKWHMRITTHKENMKHGWKWLQPCRLNMIKHHPQKSCTCCQSTGHPSLTSIDLSIQSHRASCQSCLVMTQVGRCRPNVNKSQRDPATTALKHSVIICGT